MNPDGLIVSVYVYGPRPGSGGSWLIECRDRRGAIPFQATGDRDVVLAALAEYVESLHSIAPPRDSLWPYL